MRTITVIGKGKSVKEPDLVVLEITITILKKEFDDALESMSKLVDKLKNSLKQIGFEEDDLKTTSFMIDQEYNSVEKGIITKEHSSKFMGFEVMHGLKLEFDLDNEKISEVLNCLNNYDKNLEVELGFSVKEKEEMIKEVLESATKDAKFKAELLANASSVTLGDLIKINCSISDYFYFKSDTSFEDENVSSGLGALFSSGSIMPEEIKISDTVTFEWEII